MSFQEINVREFSMKPFKMIGDQWMLVTAGDQIKYNTMTASWGGIGVMWDKNVAVTVIRPQRYTKEFVESHDCFTLSFYPKEYKKALSLCGSKSGREIDKAEKTGLIPVFDQAAPYFEQASLVLVCKKLYAQPMDPAGFVDKALDSRWYPDKDYHKMFVGEVIKVLVKE